MTTVIRGDFVQNCLTLCPGLKAPSLVNCPFNFFIYRIDYFLSTPFSFGHLGNGWATFVLVSKRHFEAHLPHRLDGCPVAGWQGRWPIGRLVSNAAADSFVRPVVVFSIAAAGRPETGHVESRPVGGPRAHRLHPNESGVSDRLLEPATTHAHPRHHFTPGQSATDAGLDDQQRRSARPAEPARSAEMIWFSTFYSLFRPLLTRYSPCQLKPAYCIHSTQPRRHINSAAVSLSCSSEKLFSLPGS
ncbi:unnamed protein product [Protopolystoma xenopodis]|uniref:Uncharacterized protein n=1 Tax=Protopolystoma xenopodis TaxID=117903 RepID=A0A3S5C4S5_9PLAT|nr:unnamed protein product [Protopolystoma xenopodis]